MQWQAHIARFSILFTLFSHRILISVHFSTHVGALALRLRYAIREAGPEWLVSGTSLPHSSEQRWILRYISRYTSHLRCAPLPVCARALSLLFSLPFVLRWSDQRVAKVEANHHAITAPGTAGTPTRSQKAATAFCRPGAFTTAVPMLQNQQSSSCVPRKKKASLSPRFPPSFRQITGGPTDRPTTGIRGIHRGE